MIAQDRPLIETEGVIRSKSGKSFYMQTYSGQHVNVLSPKSDEIHIDDIAIALAKQCRFNGHCRDFYSVAQHCVVGADQFLMQGRRDLAREFLLHDATEAFVGDMIRPVKRCLPSFSVIEDKFWSVISRKFKLPKIHSSEVHDMDNIMAVWEKRDLLPNSSEWPNMPDISALNLPKLHGWTWEVAQTEYLYYYKKLFIEVV